MTDPTAFLTPLRGHHPAVGDVTPRIGKVAPRRCVLRARLVLGPSGLRRVIDLRHTGAGEPLARLVAASEQAAFAAAAHAPRLAQALGHDDWPALYAAEKAKAPKDRRHVIARELVAWVPASEA